MSKRMTQTEELLRLAGNNQAYSLSWMAHYCGFSTRTRDRAIALKDQFFGDVDHDDALDAYSAACLEAAQYLAEGGR